MGSRINVGCGLSPTEGWLNYDNSPSLLIAKVPGLYRLLVGNGLQMQRRVAEQVQKGGMQIRFADVSRKIPERDASAEAIYSCHMLEHLDRSQAKRFLAEVWRVLSPGGIVRISVPDLRKLVAHYKNSGDANQFVELLQMGAERPTSVVGRVRQLVAGWRHHLWMYDAKSLSQLLVDCGFVDPKECQPGETRIPSPGALDLHERADESVVVEAIRP